MAEQTSSLSAGRLRGRTIVVTGAASGIGRATASLFVQEGARVAVMDINLAAAEAAAEAIGGYPVQIDVTDEASVKRAIAAAAAEFGGIDGLVNSAGIVALNTIAETTLETWKRVIDVNLTGAFLVCRETSQWLRQAEGSTIVNISSAQALQPVATAGAYAASKGGVLSFSKALAVDLAPDVRVNTICPGLVDTPMNEGLKKSADDGPPVPLDKYLLRRWAGPDEIAAAILFLTSHESSYVTGTTLAVDGGRTFH
ncbi:SDR family NAD(P)-dependent oxidoreductase [Microvirga antarctica]|uniref:SDR family NAD(P)-dependent oxidoreductase n=1 Tax=Microvirga antarctica TaxID=2819233 RepID=UPI001FE56924|nr:SDR family NAD(P)-dependent oxidoreductase [Microvirga antarctica]